MAAWFPRRCSSPSEIADRLEKIGLAAAGARSQTKLTEVFLPVLLMFDRVIESVLLYLLLDCIKAAFGFGLRFPIFA